MDCVPDRSDGRAQARRSVSADALIVVMMVVGAVLAFGALIVGFLTFA